MPFISRSKSVARTSEEFKSQAFHDVICVWARPSWAAPRSLSRWRSATPRKAVTRRAFATPQTGKISLAPVSLRLVYPL